MFVSTTPATLLQIFSKTILNFQTPATISWINLKNESVKIVTFTLFVEKSVHSVLIRLAV